jgi:hypothetical protein
MYVLTSYIQDIRKQNQNALDFGSCSTQRPIHYYDKPLTHQHFHMVDGLEYDLNKSK